MRRCIFWPCILRQVPHSCLEHGDVCERVNVNCVQMTGSLCVGRVIICGAHQTYSETATDRHTIKNHARTQHKDQTFSSMNITKKTPNIKVAWLSSSPTNLSPPFRFDCKGIKTYHKWYNSSFLFQFSWGLTLAWVSVTELIIIRKGE